MNKYFKDPDAIKKQSPKNEPVDGKNSPWDFRSPVYDQRSGDYIPAGTDYGIGMRQPVGKDKSTLADALPRGSWHKDLGPKR